MPPEFGFLVLLELVGALGEDPGEDDAVVQPAGDGNEVGNEVDRQGQVGESADEQGDRALRDALVVSLHAVGDEIVGEADVLHQTFQRRDVGDLVQRLLALPTDAFAGWLLLAEDGLVAVDDLVCVHVSWPFLLKG